MSSFDKVDNNINNNDNDDKLNLQDSPQLLYQEDIQDLLR